MEKTADEVSKKDLKKAKKAEKGPKIAPKTDTSKIYELGYILLPSLSEQQVEKEVANLASLFTKAGGELISSESPIRIDLAYQMVKVIHAHREKCNQGYFGWMKFEIETDTIVPITKALDLSETVLRYLLVKTVRENTLVNGKMNLAHGDEKMKKFDDEMDEEVEAKIDVVPEVSEEELDKTIDNLVVA